MEHRLSFMKRNSLVSLPLLLLLACVLIDRNTVEAPKDAIDYASVTLTAYRECDTVCISALVTATQGLLFDSLVLWPSGDTIIPTSLIYSNGWLSLFTERFVELDTLESLGVALYTSYGSIVGEVSIPGSIKSVELRIDSVSDYSSNLILSWNDANADSYWLNVVGLVFGKGMENGKFFGLDSTMHATGAVLPLPALVDSADIIIDLIAENSVGKVGCKSRPFQERFLFAR